MTGPRSSSLPGEVLHALTETADAAGIGVAVTLSGDPPEVLFVSEGMLSLLHYESMEEFRRVPVWDHLAPESLASVLEARRKQAAGGTVDRRLDLVLVRKDGRRIPFEVTTSPIEIGGRLGTLSYLYDVSSQRAAQEALAASEARFRTVVESAPDGVAILRGTTIIYVNPAGALMLGYDTPSGLLGRSITDVMDSADARRAGERIAKLFATRSRFAEPAEYRSRRVDGREIAVEISSIPIEYEGLPAVLAFARDITERKAIQEKLVQADRLAAVGTLAAGIAHEINNPLAYVLLGLQYLERELPKALGVGDRMQDLLARLRDVRSGAERVGTIVRDLKMFARADEVARGPVDLRSAIEAALKIAENEIRHRATLVRDYVDAPAVQGNAARLEQVFLNLLVNAAHAVSDLDPALGEIFVCVRPGDGDTVVAEVRDNGSGIPPDVLRRVFDPFFTTKPVGVGTGLGLPICRSIVESFGGLIDLSSEPGRGTIARVTLPEYASLGARHPSEAPPRRLPSVPPDVKGRLLIVDDEPIIGSLLVKMLSSRYEVTLALTGAEALRALDQGAFDAILCDVMMPGITGMDLYTMIRRKDRGLSERIVFMTGGAFVPRVAEFLSSVDNPKLEKPFDLDAVTSALRTAVARAPSAPAERTTSAVG